MSDLDGEDTHRQTRALYLLGALDSEAGVEFERHLVSCLVCLDECERLGPVLAAMATLSGEEISALVSEDDTPMP
jgi:hypothetical protein